MPNWSYNTIVLQGKKEAVHELIRIGLRNSELKSLCDIKKDWKLLKKEGKTKVKDGADSIILDKLFSARTFLPMPDTFILYDTTNYRDKYPEAAREQMEKHGAVGWYDYNYLTLGTKWNFQIEENSEATLNTVDGHKDVYRIVFSCDTAWSMPTEWLINIKKLVPQLFVGIMAYEESGEYYCVCYVNDENELVYYESYTDEMHKKFKEFGENRKKAEKEIRDDEGKMKEIRDAVCKDTNLTDEEIEDGICLKIEEIIDEKYGDYVDEVPIIEKLDLSFAKMMDEFAA